MMIKLFENKLSEQELFNSIQREEKIILIWSFYYFTNLK